MPKIVSEKAWIRFTREELERIIQNSLPEGFPEFELIEIQDTRDGHRIKTMTFGIAFNSADIELDDGPLGYPVEKDDGPSGNRGETGIGM